MLGRITKARANGSPSPGGRGQGEGEPDASSLGHPDFGLGAGKPPEGPHGFEPFIISSVQVWLSTARELIYYGVTARKNRLD